MVEQCALFTILGVWTHLGSCFLGGAQEFDKVGLENDYLEERASGLYAGGDINNTLFADVRWECDVYRANLQELKLSTFAKSVLLATGLSTPLLITLNYLVRTSLGTAISFGCLVLCGFVSISNFFFVEQSVAIMKSNIKRCFSFVCGSDDGYNNAQIRFPKTNNLFYKLGYVLSIGTLSTVFIYELTKDGR